MKRMYVIGSLLFLINNAIAQSTDPGILSTKQITALLSDSVKKELKINFPVYRVYQYADNAAQYYCVLTESRDVIKGKDTNSYQIKAVNVKQVDGKLYKTWELKDNIIKSAQEENSIWFWSKFTSFKDHDKDGFIEPVIVYGTSAMNGTSDGRIKILIYYKGQKVAIRHQNGVLDYERETQVDQAFYNLPAILQTAVKQSMELLIKNEVAIFPNGWQTAMKNKKLVFNERK